MLTVDDLYGSYAPVVLIQNSGEPVSTITVMCYGGVPSVKSP